MSKICSKCSSKLIIKDWFKRWKQRYRCKACWYVFQNKSRIKKSMNLINDYVNKRQTYNNLSERLLVSKRTIQRKIDTEKAFKKTLKHHIL